MNNEFNDSDGWTTTTIDDPVVSDCTDLLGECRFIGAHEGYHTLVAWDGISQLFLEALMGIVEDGDIEAVMVEPSAYESSDRRPDLPVYDPDNQWDGDCWVPLAIVNAD